MNSLGRTLGNEEKEVVTVSVRPGTPNTDMQTKIRELGASSVSRLRVESHLSSSRHPKLLTARFPRCRRRLRHVGI